MGNERYSAQLLVDSYPDSSYSDEDPSELISKAWALSSFPLGTPGAGGVTLVMVIGGGELAWGRVTEGSSNRLRFLKSGLSSGSACVSKTLGARGDVLTRHIASTLQVLGLKN